MATRTFNPIFELAFSCYYNGLRMLAADLVSADPATIAELEAIKASNRCYTGCNLLTVALMYTRQEGLQTWNVY
jgi:hypothetical protein